MSHMYASLYDKTGQIWNLHIKPAVGTCFIQIGQIEDINPPTSRDMKASILEPVKSSGNWSVLVSCACQVDFWLVVSLLP